MIPERKNKIECRPHLGQSSTNWGGAKKEIESIKKGGAPAAKTQRHRENGKKYKVPPTLHPP